MWINSKTFVYINNQNWSVWVKDHMLPHKLINSKIINAISTIRGFLWKKSLRFLLKFWIYISREVIPYIYIYIYIYILI